MSRLSAVASTQLTDGNPAITDLSDTNRPTRIAEKFSELYDNEWTDAFEALTSQYHMSEREAVDTLLRILKVSVQSLLFFLYMNISEKLRPSIVD